MHRERQRRMARLRDRLDLGVEVGVGLVGVAQVDEHAVLAVLGRVSQRLVGHRQDALALLAQALGHELLGPQAKARDRLGHDERELVAALESQLARHQPHPQPRVRRAGLVRVAVLLGHLGPVEEPLHRHAHQRGRNEPEVRQHRVAPADVRVVLERPPEAVLVGELQQRRSRVGDGDELAARAARSSRRSSGSARASRSSRPTSRRRGTASSRGRAASRASSTAPGSVESSTCSRIAPSISPNVRRITSGPSEEPPMPSSAQSVKPSALHLVGEGAQVAGLLEHRLGDGQPARGGSRPPACPPAPRG